MISFKIYASFSLFSLRLSLLLYINRLGLGWIVYCYVMKSTYACTPKEIWNPETQENITMAASASFTYFENLVYLGILRFGLLICCECIRYNMGPDATDPTKSVNAATMAMEDRPESEFVENKRKVRTLTPEKQKWIDLEGERDGVCGLCLEAYNDDDEVGINRCADKHYFHWYCIEEFLANQDTLCPVCKFDLRVGDEEDPQTTSLYRSIYFSHVS
eukprot:TRINITY_DN12111_c0_g1_i5.p2 TRINITY_DN12111_c0_g1~~TRINITY_DN12111_c0_g1_i5.p2  ORF type:complete len:217 (-),score=52.37 TRINITY_DN12111_c0_g1_i5:365-1015(-)